ncbi:MAG: SDR family NAD(P)-dependent oxidoreductase [Bacteroidota bacterium]
MKKALVTGASTGIGLIFCQALKKEGWDVTGVARSKEKLQQEFDQDHYMIADLSEEKGMGSLENHLKENKYNLLINNAGYGLYSKFLDTPMAPQINMMHLNMEALVRLSYAFLSTAKKGDALMNVSSALALLPMPGAAVYSATKSFVTSFTECLWYEYKDQGIYIMATSPGAVATPFHENAGSATEKMDPKMVLDPQKVVNEALKTLKARKKPSHINGTQYRFITRITQIFPRSFRLKQMANNSPGMN